MVIRAPNVAIAAAVVLPLLAPRIWDGFRLGMADPVLAVVSPEEQMLSVRTPGAGWAAIVVIAWLALVYRARGSAWWDAALVVIGLAVALTRAGNLWVLALALLVPLARQLATARLPPIAPASAAGAALVVALVTTLAARPAGVPPSAVVAALDAPARATVFADWRWAPDLQRRLGVDRRVLAAGGLHAEPTPFWIDYLRVAQGHERWDDILRAQHADVVVVRADAQESATADLVRESAEWHVIFEAEGALVAERVRN